MTRLKKRYIVDLPKHLAVCEFNYHRLLRLMPDGNVSQWEYWMGDYHANEMAMMINITDIARYTTTVHIAVHSRLQRAISWGKHSAVYSAYRAKLENTPELYSLDVRLYHDATVAEVIGWENHKRIQPRHEYPNKQMYQQDEKAQQNDFLGELLENCLSCGRVSHTIALTAD